MAEEEPKRRQATLGGTGPRQSTLVSFSPEARQMLEERGIVVPPAPVERRAPEAPRPITMPRPLVVEAPIIPGLPVIPSAVSERWRIPPDIVPYDYQVNAVTLLLAQHKGTIYFPPGSGKTLVATLAIIHLKTPTIVIVPSKVLLDQWTATLGQAGIRAGAYYGEEKRPEWVTVALYQSLYERPEIIRKFPFIVFDEADLGTADEFRTLLVESDHHPYVLAMTGTRPGTEERIRVLESRLPLLARAPLGDLGKSGHIVVPDIHPIGVALTVSESEDYEAVSKALASASAQIGGGGPEAAARLLNSPAENLRIAARRYLKAYQQRQEILNGAKNKGPAVANIVKRNPNQRILLFGNRIEPIQKACDSLNSIGVGCRLLTGETPQDERRSILSNWGRTFWVLASAQVLSRGFNVPEVSVAVIMASGQSAQQILQRLGRIARAAPGKSRADAYLVYAQGTIEEDLPERFHKVIEEG